MRLLTNWTGGAGDRSLVNLRAKNWLNILDKIGSLFLVWLISLSYPPFLCSRSSVEGCALRLAGCWRSLWPQITQHENSVHKISSRVLCIRCQGKMSHSAELKRRDVEQKELEQDISPPLPFTVFQQTYLRVSLPPCLDYKLFR